MNTIKVQIAGDVMTGRLIDQLLRSNQAPHKYVWGNVLPIFESSSVRLINLETTITTHNKKWPGKAFNFKMHPSSAQCLKEANINYCSLANNHILDYETEGMFETIQTLDSLKIAWAGAGKNAPEAIKPAILSFSSLKMACYSFADYPSEWKATGTKPGMNYLNCSEYNEKKMKKIKKEMDKIREKVDLISVSIHWGPNYQWDPPKSFCDIAHGFVDICGVNLIHGHSAHHIQGIEVYKNQVIAYGCGDFVDDYRVDEDYRNDLGFIYHLHFNESEKKWAKIELIPTKITNFQVNAITANSPDSEWLYEHMKKLCGKLGSEVKRTNDTLFQIDL